MRSGGLGGTFFGTVTPEGCDVLLAELHVWHAAPSDLFTNLGPAAAIAMPRLVRSTECGATGRQTGARPIRRVVDR